MPAPQVIEHFDAWNKSSHRAVAITLVGFGRRGGNILSGFMHIRTGENTEAKNGNLVEMDNLRD